MDLLNGFIKLSSRLFGFALIGTIMSLSIWTFSGLPPKIFLLLASIVFLVCWAIYNRFVGDLAGDVAVLIRLIMAKSGGFLSFFSSVFGHVASLRTPVAIPEESYEVARWADVESSPRVRRMLRRGRLNVFLGRDPKGKPVIVDWADEIGKFYIFADDRVGKTQLIKQMVASILLDHPYAKKEFDFVIIDKTRDMEMLSPLGRYTYDIPQAIKILKELGEEADRRNKLRVKHKFADWWHEIPVAERPRPIILIVDEAIQVLKEGGTPLINAWSNLINIGWKNGILMITTALYTRSDLIPTEFTALMRGRVLGYAVSKQSWLNVIGVDFYEKYKEILDGWVNRKFHFALCVRPDILKPFETVIVPKDRLIELAEQAAMDIEDWREVLLTIWFNHKGQVGSEELAVLTREFIEKNSPSVRANIIHKVSALETLHYAIEAGVATHNGHRNKFSIPAEIVSYGALLDKWHSFVDSGGLEKKAPTGEQLAERRKTA